MAMRKQQGVADEVTGNKYGRNDYAIRNDVTRVQEFYDECAGIVNDAKRQNRMTEMKQELAFYFNAQWEKTESEDLQATGQVDVTLNMMRRALRTLFGQMVGSKPSAKFLPRDVIPSSQAEAENTQRLYAALTALQGLWDHCWYISGETARLLRVVRSMMTCGIGWMWCGLDKRADYYRGEVVFRERLPWEVVVPLYASELDFSDAKRMFYRTQLTLEEAIAKIGKEDQRIIELLRKEAVPKTDLDWDLNMWAPDMKEVYATRIKESPKPDSEYLVEWLETEERISKKAFLYKVVMPDKLIDTIVWEPLTDDAGDGEEEVRNQLREKGIPISDLQKVEIDVDWMRNVTSVGRSIQVSSEEIPCDQFSHIPFVDEDTYNPLSIGEAFFVKPIQKLLNKVFSLAVLHLQTSGSGDKLVGLKGAFGDTPAQVDAFQRAYANPNSVTELANEYTDGADVNRILTRISATPLQPAAAQIISMLFSVIDRMTGIDPMSYGSAEKMPRTLGATMSVKEWGEETSRIPLIQFNYAMQQLGNLWLKKAIRHYRYPKAVSVPDLSGALRNFDLNMPQEDGSIVNEIETIKANVFITSGTSLMINRVSMMMMFRELIPLNPIFIKMFLLYSDIPDKFDLLKEIDQQNNLQQFVEQLLPQVEQLQGQAEAANKELQDTKEKLELTHLRGTLNQITTKYREWIKYNQQISALNDQIRRGNTREV